jgi:ferredoxin-NADP reductase
MSAYLCGPPPMIEACIRTLMKGRLFERDIFTERFVTAADGESGLSRARCSSGCDAADGVSTVTRRSARRGNTVVQPSGRDGDVTGTFRGRAPASGCSTR